MTTTTERFSEWAQRQPIRTTRMDEFVRDVLGGDEDRMVTVTQRVTPFGIFTMGMEAA